MSDPDPVILAEPAPAKLNLALHVRRRRADGRHDIETIFAFCTDGDRLQASTGQGLALTIAGPFADGLSAGDDNLVLRAARELANSAQIPADATLHLTKNLPVASGMGGGSATRTLACDSARLPALFPCGRCASPAGCPGWRGGALVSLAHVGG